MTSAVPARTHPDSTFVQDLSKGTRKAARRSRTFPGKARPHLEENGLPPNAGIGKKVQTELNYLEGAHYADFRKRGVGSGVIEAGCKSVIGKRLKQSGMEWSVQGAKESVSMLSNRVDPRAA